MARYRPSRREVLQWAAAGGAWLLAPACRSATTEPPPATPTFFTDDERSMLAALADVVVPPDDGLVGGSQLGTVSFVERMLTAFDPLNTTPTLYVAGPASDRNPVPDANGAPTSPPSVNDFLTPLPLGRASTYAWKLYLYGSDGVTGGGPNDAVLGKVVGLRDQLRNGLQAALGKLSKPVGQLNVADKVVAFGALPDDFRTLIIDLTSQACWSAPEYGGNLDAGGWKLVHFEGDVEPFGYTQWDAATQKMIERADAPVSTANPGTDPDPLDDDTRQLITPVVQFLGGKVFS